MRSRNDRVRKKISLGSEMVRLLWVLFSSVLAVVTLVVAISISSAAVRYTSAIRQNEITLIQNDLDRLENGVNVIINYMRNEFLYDTLEEPVVTETRLATFSGDIRMRRLSCNYMLSDMNLPFHVTVIGKNGLNYTSLPDAAGYDFKYLRDSLWFNLCRSSETASGMATGAVEYTARGTRRHFFAGYENFYSMDDRSWIGTMLICIDDDVVRGLYEGVQSKDKDILLFDENERLFGEYDRRMAGKVDVNIRDFVKSRESSKMFIRDGYLLVKQKSGKTGWTIVERISAMSIFGAYRRAFLLAGVVMAVLLLATAFFIRKVSRLLFVPLKDFCAAIEKTDQMTAIPEPDDNRYHEISQLYGSFSVLQEKNAFLLEDKLKSEKEARRSELKFLRAQINPHFLYNTLFYIRCTVDMKRNAEASRQIDVLTDLLRNTLRSAGETQMIGEELASVRDYVSLSQFGYDKELKLETDVEEDLQYYQIMRFLIQPLVENAIFHGIRPMRRDGKITIRVKRKEGLLRVEVEDNGAGMPKELYEKSGIPEPERRDEADHIGVANVRNRIRENYGEPCGLVYDSRPGEYTIAVMTLPLLKEAGQAPL